MKMLFACGALLALAACNSQEPAEPAEPAPVETPVVAAEPTLAPPREEDFAAAYAEACPDAPEVSTALCKSLGFGEEGFTCEYGLGEDEYRRNTATLAPGDGKWILSDPAKTCAAKDAA